MLYKGDVKLIGTFDVKAKKPLDSRSVVQNKEELFSMDHFYSYKGMPVVSVDDASIYILIDPDHIGDENGWKKVGSVDINTESGEVDLSSFVKNIVDEELDDRVISKEYLDKIIRGEITPPINEWVDFV